MKNRDKFFWEIKTGKEKKKAEDVTADGEGGGEGVEAGAVWGWCGSVPVPGGARRRAAPAPH